MIKRYSNSFREKALQYIESLPYNVVLRSDLEELGSPRQVSRVLKALLEDGFLVKLSYGVYAKSEKTPYSDRAIIKIGFTDACAEALDRLGTDWEVGTAIREYNEGKTQQVPVRFTVKLKSRMRRKFVSGKQQLYIEGGMYAR